MWKRLCSKPADLVKVPEPQTSRILGRRDRSFPISVAAVTPNLPPNSAGGRGMPQGGDDCLNGTPSPTIPFQEISGGWRTPPPPRRLGAPPASPLRRLPHGAPAAVPETPVPGRHPDFGAPGLLAASQTCLGPGPGARTGPRSARCARKSTYFAPSPGSSRPRCSRSWPQTGRSPAGRGARVAGRGSTWCKDFSFYFSTPPSLPSPNSARRGGRM